MASQEHTTVSEESPLRMDFETRVRIWRTKLVMTWLPSLPYLAFRFWKPGLETHTNYLCDSLVILIASMILSLVGVAALALTMLYTVVCAHMNALQDGRFYTLPGDAKVWASSDQVPPVRHIGGGLLICVAIEIIHRLCCLIW